MFGEKTRENVQCILVLQLYPAFVVLLFMFTGFNTKPLILLVKIISSQLKATNSGGLMLVCRWANVNDQVQNKFRPLIHLLSQHLLAQNYQFFCNLCQFKKVFITNFVQSQFWWTANYGFNCIRYIFIQSFVLVVHHGDRTIRLWD